MEESQVIAALGALAQETRLRILRFLVVQGEAGASAGEIGVQVEATASRLSFHLSALAQAGVVTSEKRSRQVIYRVDFERVGAVLSYLVQDCCGGDARLVACCSGTECC